MGKLDTIDDRKLQFWERHNARRPIKSALAPAGELNCRRMRSARTPVPRPHPLSWEVSFLNTIVVNAFLMSVGTYVTLFSSQTRQRQTAKTRRWRTKSETKSVSRKSSSSCIDWSDKVRDLIAQEKESYVVKSWVTRRLSYFLASFLLETAIKPETRHWSQAG